MRAIYHSADWYGIRFAKKDVAFIPEPLVIKVNVITPLACLPSESFREDKYPTFANVDKLGANSNPKDDVLLELPKLLLGSRLLYIHNRSLSISIPNGDVALGEAIISIETGLLMVNPDNAEMLMMLSFVQEEVI